MTENPWDVDSIEAFSFLKCPECIFDTKQEDNFLEHALQNHPLSSVFFGKRLKEEVDDTGDYDLNIEEYYEEAENGSFPTIDSDETLLPVHSGAFFMKFRPVKHG